MTRLTLTVLAAFLLSIHPAAAASQTDDSAYLESAKLAFDAVQRTNDPVLVQAVLDAFVTARPDLAASLTNLFTTEGQSGPPDAAPPPVAIPPIAVAEAAATPAQPPLKLWNAWHGAANAGFEVETGNTEEVEVDIGLDLTRQFGQWEIDTLAQHHFTEAATGGADRTRIEEEYRLRIDGRRSYGKRWTFENFLDAERDIFSGFDYRIALGIGPGYRILMGERLKWRVAAGPGVRFDQPTEQDDWSVNPVATLSSAFRWRPNDTFRLGNDFESSWGEGQVISVLSFAETNLIGRLAARLSYDVDINSDAPAPAQTTDTTTLLSLVYTIGDGK